MRVLVTGGRWWTDRQSTYRFLDLMHSELEFTLLIHGAAVGADSLCADWAEEAGVETLAFPVTKQDWKTIGRSAGVQRNQQMLDEGHPDILIAFPGGSGTNDMIRRATKQNLELWRWEDV